MYELKIKLFDNQVVSDQHFVFLLVQFTFIIAVCKRLQTTVTRL